MEVITGKFGSERDKELEEQTLDDMLDMFREYCKEFGVTEVMLVGNSESGTELFSASNMNIADQVLCMEALKHSFFNTLMAAEV